MSDLVLLSAGAAKALVERVAGAFHRETGAKIRGTFGAVGTMRDKLAAGEACDAFVSTAAILDALVGEGRVVAASIRPMRVAANSARSAAAMTWLSAPGGALNNSS